MNTIDHQHKLTEVYPGDYSYWYYEESCVWLGMDMSSCRPITDLNQPEMIELYRHAGTAVTVALTQLDNQNYGVNTV